MGKKNTHQHLQCSLNPGREIILNSVNYTEETGNGGFDEWQVTQLCSAKVGHKHNTPHRSLTDKLCWHTCLYPWIPNFALLGFASLVLTLFCFSCNEINLRVHRNTNVILNVSNTDGKIYRKIVNSNIVK